MTSPRRGFAARLHAASLLLGGLLLLGPAPLQAHEAPFRALDRLLDENPSLVGLEIRSLSGEVRYARNAQRLFTPASVLKLATSYAALRRLGSDARFRTELLSTGPVSDGQLRGPLWIKGYGDPSLRTSDLPAFVAALQANGLKQISGDLIADATLFEGPRYPSGWMWDDLERAFAAPASALSLDENAMERLAVLEAPEIRAALHLSERLSQAGIALAGTVRVGKAPAEARVLYRHESAPLSEIVRALNKDSNNFYAEALVRQLGLLEGTGSHAAGLEVMSDALEAAGWTRGTYRIADGSGLSRYSAVTPAQMAGLLVAAARMPEAPAFMASLSVAGQDGTLARRLVGTRAEGLLMAKTGTMSGVSSLCGYLAPPGKEKLAIALLVNGFVGSSKPVQALQDAVILAALEAGD